MADEGDERRRRSMDLNLYLGLPLSPLPYIPDLGSDLALGSVTSSPAPLPTVDMGDAHTPYSPSHASFASEHILMEEGGGGGGRRRRDAEDPTSPDNPIVFPSGTIDLEFPPSSLPSRPIVVFPYSPSSYRRSPPEAGDHRPGDGAASHVPYSQTSVGIAEESTVRDEGTLPAHSYDHLRSLANVRTPPQAHAEVEPYQPTPLLVEVVAGQDGGSGSSSRQEALRSPEFRFRSLIESDRRIQARNREARRFRSSISYRERNVSPNAASFPAPEQHLRAVLEERPFETSGKSKVNDDGVNKDGLEEEEVAKCGDSVNFECNICYDVAKEPVVTSCGHLFCWPCLYQWLHHYSDHKECPACKGQVVEANITPIYGRGSSEKIGEGKIGNNNTDSELKIPPRPHGHRFESLRQRIQRPISRRPGEGVTDMAFRRLIGEEFFNVGRLEGLMDPALSVMAGRLEQGASNPPRHDLDEDVQTGSRTEGQLNHAMQQFVDHSSRLISRFRARRSLENYDHEAGLVPVRWISRVASASSQEAVIQGSSNTNDRMNSFQRFSHDADPAERLHALRANLNMLVSTIARDGSSSVPSVLPISHRSNEAPPALANNQNINLVRVPIGGAQSADQASASSTMAVIQDDVGVTDTSEPSRVGSSSRSSRRRARGNTSAAYDVDGILHTNKRRRLN